MEIGPGKLAVEIYEPTTWRADAVLIHGYTGSKEDFSFIGPLLAAEGYRVLTSDNRGQHESEHSSDSEDYSIASLARDQAQLVEHFGLNKPHLLGHSFGGLVAQRAAVDFPDLWQSLTIFCSGPSGMLENYGVRDDLEFLENHSMAELWTADRAAKNEGMPFYDTRVARWHMSDKSSVMRHARHLLNEPSILPQLAQTGLPAHVIRGEFDDAWPHDVQAQMADQLAAPLSIIAGGGHCPNEEYPVATAERIASHWNRY